MAKTISISHQGQTVHCGFVRVDREKLYGRKDRIVIDQAGEPCAPAYLSSDGAALVPSGALALLYVDAAFDTVERSQLQTVDAQGTPLPLVPSTLGVEQPLQGPVDPRRILEHTITAVYQLQAEGLPAGLSAQLEAGGIFETRFCFRDDYQDHALFILSNETGLFALVGDPHGFDFVRKEVVATATPDEADDAGDDLDFSMI